MDITTRDESAVVGLTGTADTATSAPPCPLTFDTVTVLSDEFPCTRDDFPKNIQLSRDGSFLLAAYELPRIEVFAVHSAALEKFKYYQPSVSSSSSSSSPKPDSSLMTTVTGFYPGDNVYDIDWYPFVNSQDPTSQCFVTSSRDKPVQLFGLNDGLRCNYCIVNHLDELASATCVGFNLTGDKIFCGSTRMLTSFDVDVPGRSGSSIATSETKRDPMGQRGVMSCIDFNPDQSQTFAVGTYANSVAIYTESDLECVLELKDLSFGVSHVKWSPCGNYLWVGGRQSNKLACWDVRSSRSEVGTVLRSLRSNQKMSFDIDPWGKFLATGSQDGELLIYDTATFELKSSSTSITTTRRVDCLNSVQFHPYSAMLFTAAGQRTFPDFDSSSDEGSEDSEACAGNKRKMDDVVEQQLHRGSVETTFTSIPIAQTKGVPVPSSPSLQVWAVGFNPILLS